MRQQPTVRVIDDGSLVLRKGGGEREVGAFSYVFWQEPKWKKSQIPCFFEWGIPSYFFSGASSSSILLSCLDELPLKVLERLPEGGVLPLGGRQRLLRSGRPRPEVR